MKWIYNLPVDRLKEEMSAVNIKKFVAHQIFSWIYAKNIQDINQWTNISKTNRQILANLYDTTLNPILKISEDQEGTKKILVELPDKHKIEAVLIKEQPHYTFCISTQVGCPLKCKFCATGRMGFMRNLSPGEIVSQVLLLKKQLRNYKGKINIVLMGMGEPLLNYDNLKIALGIITYDKGIAIAPRHICLSTAGILKEIVRLERDFPKIKLSFSLNAPDSSLREQLMPISQKEPLDKILEYFQAFKEKRKFRLTVEYVLLKGVNDSLADAKKVAALIRGIPCKINLIPYNECEPFRFKTPDKHVVDAFSDYLYSKGYTVMVRWSKGKEIKSACGQLAGEG
ncbi:MAG: 23S rRNA (adenine(2503)-C(2))-methyltransferase RlmN [Candidatus Aminicenantes bacterium]|jgi:23S rRNA (adenine2503-C2)-methyltransferase